MMETQSNLHAAHDDLEAERERKEETSSQQVQKSFSYNFSIFFVGYCIHSILISL